MDGPDPVRELPVGGGPRRPGRGGGIPGVEGGPVDLDDLTQPLHLEGVSVVGNQRAQRGDSSPKRNTWPPDAGSTSRSRSSPSPPATGRSRPRAGRPSPL